jgi:hypothetical protein
LAAAGFDVGWLATRSLPPDQSQAYFDVMSALRADDPLAALRAFDDAMTDRRSFDDALTARRSFDDATTARRSFDDALTALRDYYDALTWRTRRANDAVKAEAYWAVTQ